MEATDYIPRENFNLWLSLFKKSGGRFIGNPIDGKRVYVRYTFNDPSGYSKLTEEYQRLTTPIRETRRGLLKKFKLFLHISR